MPEHITPERSEHITKGPAPVAQGLLDVLAEGNENVRRARWLEANKGAAMPVPWSVPFARIAILLMELHPKEDRPIP